LPLSRLLPGLVLATGLVTVLSLVFIRLISRNAAHWFAALLLSLACLLAIQAQVFHEITYFGQFDGAIVDFRRYGWWFWGETVLLVVVGLALWALFGLKPALMPTLAWLPLASFTLMWMGALEYGNVDEHQAAAKQPWDERVFEFSSHRNLVHILPDALSADLVAEAFRKRPDLSAAFDGFEMFSNHLGAYHGTAPALPTLLTGIPFDFTKGHTYHWIAPLIRKRAYANDLSNEGFELDLVTINPAYCPEQARSCISRPFSDWKSRGYYQHREEGLSWSLRVLADLVLYRVSPSAIKERIHNNGNWWLAGLSADGASPWPDPVLKEWSENMRVVDAEGRYKFYHYAGSHKPVFWTADCVRTRMRPRSRENYLAQTECVLSGLAEWLQVLDLNGIYDQTAIMISGDHGMDMLPNPWSAKPEKVPLDGAMMGLARPALLAKPLNSRGPIRIRAEPTSLVDVASMALSLARGAEAIEQDREPGRVRSFYVYSVPDISRWNSDPIAFARFDVEGAVDDEESWSLAEMSSGRNAPFELAQLSHAAAQHFTRGLRLDPSRPDNPVAWVDFRQLGITLRPPVPPGGSLELHVRLHIPDWLETQSVSLTVNGKTNLPAQGVTAGDLFWQDIYFELPPGTVDDRENWFVLEFRHLATEPNGSGRKAAALLQSIRLTDPSR
jgi:hypothetical protein